MEHWKSALEWKITQKISDLFIISRLDRDVLKYSERSLAWDPEDNQAFYDLKPFKHQYKGLLGVLKFKSLKEINKDDKFRKVTPGLDSQIDSIQFNSPINQQKDDSVLFIEQKKDLLSLRNQDFKNFGFVKPKHWGDYFGFFG